MYFFIHLGTYYFQVVSDDKDIIIPLRDRWLTVTTVVVPPGKKIIIDVGHLLKKCEKKFKRLKDNLNISKLDYCDLLITAFIERALVKKRVFFLHGSAVVYKNRAIVFLGPSGAGKSTILTRIEKPRVYAEDTVIVRMVRNHYAIIKSVFDKKHINMNDSKEIDLKALYFLAKSKKDFIKRLSTNEYLENILHNNILIMSELTMDKDIQRLHLSHLFSLTANIPGNTLFFKKTGRIKMSIFDTKED